MRRRLNVALEAAGITPFETDLADLIIQLGHDKPSHIVVPALHKNRSEIRQLFLEKMGLGELGHRPQDLTNAARAYLREKFLRVKVGFSGANFAIAETGSVCVVESEGNGRMCLTLPEVLITQVGIEKIIPRCDDLEVFLQLLAALRHRRAHEPLQLDLDRRRAGRRTARVPHRAPRQWPHQSAGG
jgi:L-lactate dehydrogenase complex protein LldF